MRVLVDTSVWIRHLRTGDARLVALLENAEVLAHPLVIGELACGNLSNRGLFLASMRELPSAVAATHDETLRFVGDRKLWANGIGWIDAQLMASALITHCRLWTLDENLNRASDQIGVRFPSHA